MVRVSGGRILVVVSLACDACGGSMAGEHADECVCSKCKRRAQRARDERATECEQRAILRRATAAELVAEEGDECGDHLGSY